MTARVSTRSSKLLPYFLYRLSLLKYNMAAALLAGLLSFPLLALTENAVTDVCLERELNFISGQITVLEMNNKVAEVQAVAGLLQAAAAAAIFALLILGFSAARRSFKYLYDRKYTDMILSLPLSSAERFIGDFSAGLAAYVLPAGICTLTAELIITHSAAVRADRPDLGYGSSLMYFVQHGGIMIFLACLTVYCFTVFIVTLSGRALTARVLPGLCAVLLPVAAVFLTYTAYSSGYGLDYDPLRDGVPLPVLCLSPFGTAVSLFFMGTAAYEQPLAAEYIAFPLIYSALYVAGALVCGKFRRHERMGRAFAFSGAKYAVQALFALASASLLLISAVSVTGEYYGYSSFGYLFMYDLFRVPKLVLVLTWLMLTAGVFWLIEYIDGGELLRLRRFLPALGRFALSCGASAAVMYGLTVCDCFGEVSFIPSDSEIRSVYLSPGNIDTFTLYGGNTVSGEKTALVTSLQRQILSERPKADNGSYEQGSITLGLRYTLTDGRSVSRNYTLPKEYCRPVLSLMFESGAFTGNYRLSGSFGRYRAEDGTPVAPDIVCHPVNAAENARYDRYGRVITDITAAQLEAAMTADAENTDFEKLYLSDRVFTASVTAENDSFSESFVIYSFFENTVELFRRHGYELFADLPECTERYFLCAYRSVGSFSVNYKWDYGYEREYREITKEQARELYEHSSVTCAYETERTVYALDLVSIRTTEDGLKYTEPYYLRVTEGYSGRAEEIYELSPAVSEEDARNYLHGGVILGSETEVTENED